MSAAAESADRLTTEHITSMKELQTSDTSHSRSTHDLVHRRASPLGRASVHLARRLVGRRALADEMIAVTGAKGAQGGGSDILTVHPPCSFCPRIPETAALRHLWTWQDIGGRPPPGLRPRVAPLGAWRAACRVAAPAGLSTVAPRWAGAGRRLLGGSPGREVASADRLTLPLLLLRMPRTLRGCKNSS